MKRARSKVKALSSFVIRVYAASSTLQEGIWTLARPLAHFPRLIGSPSSGPILRLCRSRLSYPSIAGCGRMNVASSLISLSEHVRPGGPYLESSERRRRSDGHWVYAATKDGAERERADFTATTPRLIRMAQ